jgi:hypothetical protein
VKVIVSRVFTAGNVGGAQNGGLSGATDGHVLVAFHAGRSVVNGANPFSEVSISVKTAAAVSMAVCEAVPLVGPSNPAGASEAD